MLDRCLVEPGERGTTQTQDSPTPPNTPETANSETIPTTKKRGKPGLRTGSQGYSRELTLEVTRIQPHYPAECTGCCQTFKAVQSFVHGRGITNWKLASVMPASRASLLNTSYTDFWLNLAQQSPYCRN